MGVCQGQFGDVFCSASPSVALGAFEQATDSGDHQNYTMSVHRYWDKRVPVVVQTSATLGGTYATVTNYTFRYCGGLLQFTVPNTNTFVKILTGNFFNVTQLGDCSEWNLDLGGDIVDTTTFQTTGWKAKTPTVKQCAGKLMSFRVDDRLEKEFGNLMIFVLYVSDAFSVRFECYGWLTQVVPKETAVGVLTQEASFVTDADVFLYLAP